MFLASFHVTILINYVRLNCRIKFYLKTNNAFISSPKARSVKVFRENGVFLYSIGNSPGLAVDRFNNLVVCDLHKARLQIFTREGKFVNIIEGQHTELSEPYSVAASGTGQLFVTDIKKISEQVFL